MKIPAEPVRKRNTKAPRPKDASTLIIYRFRQNNLEVLMGKRHRKHKFLPQRYVFPGGRVDLEDSRVRYSSPIKDDVEELLVRRNTTARARALVAAAIRETYEETGLMLGRIDPEPTKNVPKTWKNFFATGLAPSFEEIDYVARAVTPHWRPIRFNARFFMVEYKHLTGKLTGSGELLNLKFMSVVETKTLTLALITTRVLELVENLLRQSPSAQRKKHVILFKHNGKFHDIIQE
ncbi:MAG: NUDIX hydrolase [Pseudomonadota bacterium]|nr:NUDIX hydrolase [Pseudomonadota bacterium]